MLHDVLLGLPCAGLLLQLSVTHAGLPATSGLPHEHGLPCSDLITLARGSFKLLSGDWHSVESPLVTVCGTSSPSVFIADGKQHCSPRLSHAWCGGAAPDPALAALSINMEQQIEVDWYKWADVGSAELVLL